MPHLVGNGAVHVTTRLQFSNQPKSVVQHHDSILLVKRWAGVCKSLGASQAVVVVDFGHDKNVDVVVSIPSRQLFHVSFESACDAGLVAKSSFGIALQLTSVHSNNAICGFVAWCALGQFKLNAGVYANAVSGSSRSFSEIVIQSFNGRDDLCIADVFGNTNGGTLVDHMNHHGQSDHSCIHAPLPVGLHGHDSVTQRFKVPCIGWRSFHIGLVNHMSETRLGLSLHLRTHKHGQQTDGGGNGRSHGGIFVDILTYASLSQEVTFWHKKPRRMARRGLKS